MLTSKRLLLLIKVYKILELEGRIQALARQLFDTEGDCGFVGIWWIS